MGKHAFGARVERSPFLIGSIAMRTKARAMLLISLSKYGYSIDLLARVE
jgi:hypothetical protein